MKYSIDVIRSFDQLETLRPVWERWQVHPNSDFDHYQLVCRQRSNSCAPFVLVAGYNGEPCSILVARLEKGEFVQSFGYSRPLRLPVGRLAVIHQGVLGQMDERVASLFFDGLRSVLVSGEVDLVELFHVPENLVLLRTVIAQTPWLWRDGEPAWNAHRDFVLTKEPGGLLQKMSSKHRAWVRRKTRDIDAAFPGRWRFLGISAGTDLGQLFQELEAVARRTYQRSLGAGFVDDQEQRARFALFHKRNQLRAWTLIVDDIPRAYAVGLVYKNTFHFSATGYDPDFRRFELGTLVFHHMVEELSNEGVGKFDFGLGDAGYKQRFGERSWREGTVRLYRRSSKGLVMKCVAGLVTSATGVSRRLAERLGVVQRIKTNWRRRLLPQKSAAEEVN